MVELFALSYDFWLLYFTIHVVNIWGKCSDSNTTHHIHKIHHLRKHLHHSPSSKLCLLKEFHNRITWSCQEQDVNNFQFKFQSYWLGILENKFSQNVFPPSPHVSDRQDNESITNHVNFGKSRLRFMVAWIIRYPGLYYFFMWLHVWGQSHKIEYPKTIFFCSFFEWL